MNLARETLEPISAVITVLAVPGTTTFVKPVLSVPETLASIVLIDEMLSVLNESILSCLELRPATRLLTDALVNNASFKPEVLDMVKLLSAIGVAIRLSTSLLL